MAEVEPTRAGDFPAAGVVLAAGAGRRFGATKQLATVGGRPLVAHAVRAAAAAGLDPVVVVVGHDAEAVATAAGAAGPVVVAANPAYAQGQATSLRVGLEAVTRTDARVAVVLLADQPGVTPSTIRAVVAAVHGPVEAARIRYRDGAGHPVALARSVWPRLRRLEGDAGARQVLDELRLVEVSWDGDVPYDVDTAADLPPGGE